MALLIGASSFVNRDGQTHGSKKPAHFTTPPKDASRASDARHKEVLWETARQGSHPKRQGGWMAEYDKLSLYRVLLWGLIGCEWANQMGRQAAEEQVSR